MSNYFLYLIFTTQTGFYIYYAFIYEAENKTCYASLPDIPAEKGTGRNIS